MSTRIAISRDHLTEVEAHLDRPEEVVFMLARFAEDTFEIFAVDAIKGTEIESQSAVHIALADEVRPRLLRWAAENEASLIEAHSHSPDYPQFSGSDLYGFEQWVPHVMWRLGDAPYAALVRSGEEWDALAWTDSPDTAVAVSGIEITGEQPAVISPTGYTLIDRRRPRRPAKEASS